MMVCAAKRWLVLMTMTNVGNAITRNSEERADLTKRLIIASSPFISDSIWRPSNLLRRLTLSQREKAMMDMDVGASSIHEVQVSAGRQGRALYTPGPSTHR